MCGIAGAWDPTAAVSGETLEDAALRMTATLQHRGPDDQGTWIDPDAGVALAHRRLSIIDLSPEGHQPMVSSSSRYVLTYNGELYNFRQLRDELERRHHSRFRGRSDTEVLLAACETWGLRGALDRFNGMFAFAVWDREERVLHLVRDRLGEKPLYYGWVGGKLVFGSQLRALVAHPDVGRRLEVDRDALSAFLQLNYVPTPQSIYRGISKLPAGTVLTVRARDPAGTARPESFWPFADIVSKARAGRTPIEDVAAVEQLDALLRDAVRLRMHSDVPLGAFLSGGIDSATIVSLLQAESAQPVRTFTVGFRDRELDESGHARAVARHLATDHTEIQLSPGAALDMVPDLPDAYDEPFADPSQLPTMAIARVARRHVTVCLSGDGGDEVFGGYNRYTQGQRLWNVLGRIPYPLRQSTARALRSTPRAVLDPLLPPAKAQKLASVLSVAAESDLFPALVSSWDDPDAVVVGARKPRLWPDDDGLPVELEGTAERMMFLDSISTLPDEMLAKVDRASMAVGLEVRVPLLDPRVVELAWALPREMRIRDGKGKWLLRQVLDRYVPRELVERPKAGFDPPIAGWLRGELRPWAEALLDSSRLAQEGYFRPDPVRRCWDEHLSGARNWDYRLWGVLMFQAWLERQ